MRAGAPRERRSRDRYGRDRRERSPRETAPVEGQDTAPAAAENTDREEAPVRSYFTQPVAAQPAPTPQVVAPEQEAPRPVTAVAVPVAAPAPAPAVGMPKVVPYTLSLDDLRHVAQASGLEWVNSDADKVAEVQAAIAAEPKPIHVPREPRPVVVIDEGPLVLVETRKDLSEVRLPFEAR